MSRALLVLSGGMDSAICGALARVVYDDLIAVSFSYGQRNYRELKSATRIANTLKIEDHRIVDLERIFQSGDSALLKSGDLSSKDTKHGYTNAFVPNRNAVFLTSSATIAMQLECSFLVTGLIQTTTSNFPDCKRPWVDKLEDVIRQGSGIELNIHTPLIYMSKKETLHLASRLPLGMECVKNSWSCYEDQATPCEICAPCVQRIAAFKACSMEDPALSVSNAGWVT